MNGLIASLIVIVAVLTPMPTGAEFVGWDRSDEIAISDELVILADKTGKNLADGVVLYHLETDAKKHSCWADAVGAKCYGAFDYANDPKMRGLIVHELGHKFFNENELSWASLGYSLGYYENGKYIHVSGVNPITGRYERTDLGYIEPNQPYCQHCSYMDPGGQSYREDFADMFMAWAMGYFSHDEAGRLRREFMDNFLGQYFEATQSAALAVKHGNIVVSYDK